MTQANDVLEIELLSDASGELPESELGSSSKMRIERKLLM